MVQHSSIDHTGIPGVGGTPPDLEYGTYERTAGNYTTTSTSFVNVDGTNLDIALTTGARVCLIILSAETGNSGALQANYFDVDVDGTRLGGDYGLTGVQFSDNGATGNASFCVPVLVTAAAHNFTLMWRTTGGTATLYGATAGTELRFSVIELYAA